MSCGRKAVSQKVRQFHCSLISVLPVDTDWREYSFDISSRVRMGVYEGVLVPGISPEKAVPMIMISWINLGVALVRMLALSCLFGWIMTSARAEVVADDNWAPPAVGILEPAYGFEEAALHQIRDRAPSGKAFDAFLMATLKYWEYQADRIDETKRAAAAEWLGLAYTYSKAEWRDHPEDVDLQFLFGISCCNRARFHVEESSWSRAYFDSREGIQTLDDLLTRRPDYVDALFPLGVVEAYLADAPVLLKPLARLLGFRGNAEDGLANLRKAADSGVWTRVEAGFYLGYYYYSVRKDIDQAHVHFAELYAQYPQNPVFGYLYGRVCELRHDAPKALDVYRSNEAIALKLGAMDIANWSGYRAASLLLETGSNQEALSMLIRLRKRIAPHAESQEYFLRLPYEMSRALIGLGRKDDARRYLEAVDVSWDRDTYRLSRALLRTLPKD